MQNRPPLHIQASGISDKFKLPNQIAYATFSDENDNLSYNAIPVPVPSGGGCSSGKCGLTPPRFSSSQKVFRKHPNMIDQTNFISNEYEKIKAAASAVHPSILQQTEHMLAQNSLHRSRNGRARRPDAKRNIQELMDDAMEYGVGEEGDGYSSDEDESENIGRKMNPFLKQKDKLLGKLTHSIEQASSHTANKKRRLLIDQDVQDLANHPSMKDISGNKLAFQAFGSTFVNVPNYYRGTAAPAARRRFIDLPKRDIQPYTFQVPQKPNYQEDIERKYRQRKVQSDLANRVQWYDDGKKPGPMWGIMATDRAFADFGRPHRRQRQDVSSLDKKQVQPYPQMSISGTSRENHRSVGIRQNAAISEPQDQPGFANGMGSVIPTRQETVFSASQVFQVPKKLQKYNARWNMSEKGQMEGVHYTHALENQVSSKNQFRFEYSPLQQLKQKHVTMDKVRESSLGPSYAPLSTNSNSKFNPINRRNEVFKQDIHKISGQVPNAQLQGSGNGAMLVRPVPMPVKDYTNHDFSTMQGNASHNFF